MKRYLAHIAIADKIGRQFVKDAKKGEPDVIKNKIEDSFLICPQVRQMAIFIDPVLTKNKFKKLLQDSEMLQFGKTFLYDTGSEALPITLNNYKSIPYTQWLDEMPKKYIPDEIN